MIIIILIYDLNHILNHDPYPNNDHNPGANPNIEHNPGPKPNPNH